MAQIKSVLNGSASAWLRLIIQIAVLGALVCVAWGRIDNRVSENKTNIVDNKTQYRVLQRYMQSVDLRLGRIEGALGTKGEK